MNMFSHKERGNYLAELQEYQFDLLIIGGGITGAGIALDASSRGLKCALLEKKDFSWGTSSRSTKLIHGGLRYLKQLQFGIVKEVGLERKIVYNNALHIVRPLDMALPIIKGGTFSKFSTYLGLSVYDYLAAVDPDERKKMLNKKEAAQALPLIPEDLLKGACIYTEYRTDDSRLVLENLKKAVSIGAIALNYLEVKELNKQQDGSFQIISQDLLANQSITIRSKLVVNASGPWVDQLRQEANREEDSKLFLSKGVHIVVDHTKFPIDSPIYFDVEEDNRMIFAIPRGNVVYIGPTDTEYRSTIDHPYADAMDVQYLLKATNQMFPSLNLSPEDIVSTWAGLRPLIFEKDKSPSEMSRKDEVFISENGLITIAGGKLTGYRKMAEKIVDKVVQELRTTFQIAKRYPACFTDEIKLSGSEFKNEKELRAYHDKLKTEIKSLNIDDQTLEYLIYTYGRNTDLIIGRIHSDTQAGATPLQKFLRAETWYAIDHELTTSINDFLIRRTGRLYFDRSFSLKYLDWIAKSFADELGWDEAKCEAEKQLYKKEAAQVMQFLT